MAEEYAEIDLKGVHGVSIETKEFGEISVSESTRGVTISVGDTQLLVLPKSDNTLLQNSTRTEKE